MLDEPGNNEIEGLQNAGKVIPKDFILKCRLTCGRGLTPSTPRVLVPQGLPAQPGFFFLFFPDLMI
jgi:hypothetical protein